MLEREDSEKLRGKRCRRARDVAEKEVPQGKI